MIRYQTKSMGDIVNGGIGFHYGTQFIFFVVENVES